MQALWPFLILYFALLMDPHYSLSNSFIICSQYFYLKELSRYLSYPSKLTTPRLAVSAMFSVYLSSVSRMWWNVFYAVVWVKVSLSHCVHCVSSTQHIDTFLLLQDVSNNPLIPITGPPSEQTSLMMNKLNISSYNHPNQRLPLWRSA